MCGENECVKNICSLAGSDSVLSHKSKDADDFPAKTFINFSNRTDHGRHT